MSRQSPLYNQDLNFQFVFKNKLGQLILDKRIIDLLKSVRGKFLQDIYLEYLVIFEASRLQFGTGHYSTLPKLYGIGYICKVCLQVPKNGSSQNRVVFVLP